jgi:lambda family phage portal protein
MVKLFNFLKRSSKQIVPAAPRQEKIQSSYISDGYSYQYNDGGKFLNGFGETKLFINDYWTLRERSAQLFKENPYARGIIRRLVTNEINSGLTPEVIPVESILGFEAGELGDWAEMVEDRFAIWADSKRLCDTTRQSNFGKLQRIARAEALITGDALIVLRMDRITGLPRVQIYSGTNIVDPLATVFKKLPDGNHIEYGVELNKFNQHVAYYVVDINGKINRIPAFGAKSGRRIAWMVYGSDKRIGEVRGEPMLSVVLQNLKEIDRYRDATQRKAVVNSILAMFIKKTEDKPGTKPLTGGAVKKGSGEITDTEGDIRKYNIANMHPGMTIETLQHGEEPVAFGNQGIDTNFGDFEASVLRVIAWMCEIPPEILQLSFSSNYSASQAANNEFTNYLNKAREEFGADFCQPIYQEWLLSEVLSQKIITSGQQLLNAWRDPLKYDIFGAWLKSDWSGAVKPSTDPLKQTKAYERKVANGWITNDRAAKELNGTKFSRNMQTIKRENETKKNAGLQVVGATEQTEESENEDEKENG